MIIHNAEYARRMADKNRFEAESERKKKEAAARNAAFDEINDSIQSAINGGRTEVILSHRLRQDVKDDLILAGYSVQDFESQDDGWPMTKVTF